MKLSSDCAHLSHIPDFVSLQRLPLENFVNIIRLVWLHTEHDLHHIAATRPALLCRMWHRAIVKAPHLWARLGGSVPFNILEKYLERSQGFFSYGSVLGQALPFVLE